MSCYCGRWMDIGGVEEEGIRTDLTVVSDDSESHDQLALRVRPRIDEQSHSCNKRGTDVQSRLRSTCTHDIVSQTRKKKGETTGAGRRRKGKKSGGWRRVTFRRLQLLPHRVIHFFRDSVEHRRLHVLPTRNRRVRTSHLHPCCCAPPIQPLEGDAAFDHHSQHPVFVFVFFSTASCLFFRRRGERLLKQVPASDQTLERAAGRGSSHLLVHHLQNPLIARLHRAVLEVGTLAEMSYHVSFRPGTSPAGLPFGPRISYFAVYAHGLECLRVGAFIT